MKKVERCRGGGGKRVSKRFSSNSPAVIVMLGPRRVPMPPCWMCEDGAAWRVGAQAQARSVEARA